jgi:hypothetical protein
MGEERNRLAVVEAVGTDPLPTSRPRLRPRMALCLLKTSRGR